MESAAIVPFGSVAPSRWANGAGRTVELARHPRTGEFAWRLSIATVESSAPFSELPGVERALMPLDEGGLTLDIDGRELLVGRFDVARFAGEAAVRATGVVAAGRDLNLMVRRTLGCPELRVVEVEGDFAMPSRALAMVVAEGVLTWRDRPLGVGDCIRGDAPVTGTGVVVVASVGAMREDARSLRRVVDEPALSAHVGIG